MVPISSTIKITVASTIAVTVAAASPVWVRRVLVVDMNTVASWSAIDFNFGFLTNSDIQDVTAISAKRDKRRCVLSFHSNRV